MWIIDRFEGDFAVVECDDITFNVPKSTLPEGASEGDVISLNIDREKKAERQSKVDSLMNKLFGENR